MAADPGVALHRRELHRHLERFLHQIKDDIRIAGTRRTVIGHDGTREIGPLEAGGGVAMGDEGGLEGSEVGDHDPACPIGVVL